MVYPGAREIFHNNELPGRGEFRWDRVPDRDKIRAAEDMEARMRLCSVMTFDPKDPWWFHLWALREARKPTRKADRMVLRGHPHPPHPHSHLHSAHVAAAAAAAAVVAVAGGSASGPSAEALETPLLTATMTAATVSMKVGMKMEGGGDGEDEDEDEDEIMARSTGASNSNRKLDISYLID